MRRAIGHRVTGNGEQLVQGWFAIREDAAGVFSIWEPLHAERVRSSLVIGSRSALLIDTGMGVGDIRAVVEGLTTLPVTVVNSHAHWDHVGGNWRFAEIAIHAAEADDLTDGVAVADLARWFAPEMLLGEVAPGLLPADLAIQPSRATTTLHGGEHFDLGGVTLEVIYAPGHSAGGIVLLERARGLLFSTDVAYPSTLYCISSGSNVVVYAETMRQLADLTPSLSLLIPSHDESPMDPAYLPSMSRALDEIVAGRTPDAEQAGDLIHRFPEGGFGVRIRPGVGDGTVAS